MKYFLHPLVQTEDNPSLFLLTNEEDTSIVVRHEDIPEIAKILNNYLRDGTHDGAKSWSEYKEAEQPKLITITEALDKAELQGLETPTDRAIRKWIVQGKLAAQKVGKTWQFEENDFFSLIETWHSNSKD